LSIVNLFKCYKVLVCSNEKAKIKNFVDQTFIVPVEKEADIHFNLIPSNSILNNVMYFNFILNDFIEKSNLNLENYKLNHPSGDIGFKTKKIKDFISSDVFICRDINLSIKEVINIVKKNKSGIIFEHNKLFYGIITTKDILNIYLENDFNLEKSIEKFINKNPFTIEDPESLITTKIELLKKYKVFKFIPVLKNGIFLGIIDNSKILKYL